MNYRLLAGRLTLSYDASGRAVHHAKAPQPRKYKSQSGALSQTEDQRAPVEITLATYNPQSPLDKADDDPEMLRCDGDRPAAIAAAFQTAGARIASAQEACGQSGPLNRGNNHVASGPSTGKRAARLRFNPNLPCAWVDGKCDYLEHERILVTRADARITVSMITAPSLRWTAASI